MSMVNLLDWRSKALTKRRQLFLVASSIALLVIIVTVFILVRVLASQYKNNIEQAQQWLTETQKKQTQINQVKSELLLLHQQRNQYKQMKLHHLENKKVISLLACLETKLADGIWLVNMGLNRGKLSINGVAFQNEKIVTLGDVLIELPFLHQVRLANIQKIELSQMNEAYKYAYSAQWSDIDAGE